MPSAAEIAEAVWDKTTTPAGAKAPVSMETIQRWRDAAEKDTREIIKAEVAAARRAIEGELAEAKMEILAAIAELTPPAGGTDA